MTLSILGQQLQTAGHEVVPCAYCGRHLARDLDHAGRRGAPPRKYCSVPCREAAAGRRRSIVTQSVRTHRRRYGALIERHALEAAGQTAIGGPLPPVPDVQAVGA